MKILETKLQDCFLIDPIVFEDERGFFLETFQLERYSEYLGQDIKFVQDIKFL